MNTIKYYYKNIDDPFLREKNALLIETNLTQSQADNIVNWVDILLDKLRLARKIMVEPHRKHFFCKELIGEKSYYNPAKRHTAELWILKGDWLVMKKELSYQDFFPTEEQIKKITNNNFIHIEDIDRYKSKIYADAYKKWKDYFEIKIKEHDDSYFDNEKLELSKRLDAVHLELVEKYSEIAELKSQLEKMQTKLNHNKEQLTRFLPTKDMTLMNVEGV